MWDLLQQTLHVIAQVGNEASALADTALTGAQSADTATALIGAEAVDDASALIGAQSLDTATALTQAAPGALDVPPVGQDMGMLSFIAQSDLVGKSLFAILVLMSLLSWYLIFAKVFVNASRRSRTRKFLKEFWAAKSLDDVERRWGVDGEKEPFSRLTCQAINARSHHARYGGTNLEESGSTAAFVMRSMRKIIDQETAKLENGLTILASIGSTAPFVGLFGTVWGVYHALIGIGMSDGVTVNSIAGPVGEALIMTGLGLAVAIPAVLAYNGFVRSNRVYLAQLDTFAHDLFSFLSTGQPVQDKAVKASQPDLRVASGGV